MREKERSEQISPRRIQWCIIGTFVGMFSLRTRNCGHLIWLSIDLNGMLGTAEGEKNVDFLIALMPPHKNIKHAEQHEEEEEKKEKRMRTSETKGTQKKSRNFFSLVLRLTILMVETKHTLTHAHTHAYALTQPHLVCCASPFYFAHQFFFFFGLFVHPFVSLSQAILFDIPIRQWYVHLGPPRIATLA